jgi:hypothetical protein
MLENSMTLNLKLGLCRFQVKGQNTRGHYRDLGHVAGDAGVYHEIEFKAGFMKIPDKGNKKFEGIMEIWAMSQAVLENIMTLQLQQQGRDAHIRCVNSEKDCFEGVNINLYGKPKVYIARVNDLIGHT